MDEGERNFLGNPKKSLKNYTFYTYAFGIYSLLRCIKVLTGL
jgi:hypothetical protein